MNFGLAEAGIVALCLVGVAITLGLAILYIRTVQTLLDRCAPESRAMEPVMVWLLLVPVFNLVWQFVVVNNVTKSLQTEFARRTLPLDEAEPGRTLGLVAAICSLVPGVGIAGAVFWILHWAKLSGYSARLA